MEKQKRKSRNVSLDVLRVVSMLMIVILHVQGKTNWLRMFEVGEGDWILRWGLEAVCIVAVNCYILISGYFSIQSKFSFRKVITLWLTVWTWGLVLFSVSLLHGETLTDKDLITLLFPFSTRTYWYVTVYIGFYILFPFLKKIVTEMSREVHKSLIMVLLGVVCVLPTIIPFSIDNGLTGLNGLDGCNIVWFITLFLVAAYIRKYQDTFKPHNSLFYVAIYLLSVTGMIFNQIIFTFIEEKFGMLDWMSEIPYTYASVLNTLASVALFMAFAVKREVKSKRIGLLVEKTVPVVFGVYIIHESPFIREILWEYVVKIFGNDAVGFAYVLQVLGIAISVFVLCGIAEAVRLRVMRKIQNGVFIGKISDKVEEFMYSGILNAEDKSDR